MAILITFLFATNLWGTISDWAIFSVTLATAIFLYKTLKSQQEVQQTQNELFRIESIRFKESIKPILRYCASNDKMKPGDENKKILTVEVINETESAALEISRILSEDTMERQIFIPMSFADRRDHLTKGDSPLLFHFLIDLKSPGSKYVTFAIKYKDIAGTKYKQRVFCICDEYGIEIHPYLPEIINFM